MAESAFAQPLHGHWETTGDCRAGLVPLPVRGHRAPHPGELTTAEARRCWTGSPISAFRRRWWSSPAVTRYGAPTSRSWWPTAPAEG